MPIVFFIYLRFSLFSLRLWRPRPRASTAAANRHDAAATTSLPWPRRRSSSPAACRTARPWRMHATMLAGRTARSWRPCAKASLGTAGLTPRRDASNCSLPVHLLVSIVAARRTAWARPWRPYAMIAFWPDSTVMLLHTKTPWVVVATRFVHSSAETYQAGFRYVLVYHKFVPTDRSHVLIPMKLYCSLPKLHDDFVKQIHLLPWWFFQFSTTQIWFALLFSMTCWTYALI